MARTEYEVLLRAEVERAIRFQEEIGLDVVVHGEFERNDMVDYVRKRHRGRLDEAALHGVHHSFQAVMGSQFLVDAV